VSLKNLTLLLPLLAMYDTICQIPHINHPPEKPITIVITGYNNKKWFRTSLDSALNQNYENFRVIYVDDASPDGTGREVANYLATHPQAHRVTLIENQERCRKLKNIYNTYHTIDDWNIIVQLDGDDWLAHNDVLKKVNHIYSTKNVWLTYGQFKNYGYYCGRKDGRGYCSQTSKAAMTSHCFRKKATFMYMHLRTFYAWLFKSIKLESLLAIDIPGFKGQFYPYANDAAFMYPMLEMARYHFLFVPDVLYVCNRTNPLCGFKKENSLQRRCHLEIKNKYESYKALGSAPKKVSAPAGQAALVVFATTTPSKLSDVLHSFHQNISGLATTCIIYETGKHSCAYEEIERRNPDTTCFKIDPQQKKPFAAVKTYLKSLTCDYVLLADDNHQLTQNIELSTQTQALEKTGAYAFLLETPQDTSCKNVGRTGRPELVYQHVHGNICVTKACFCNANSIHNCRLSLYRKTALFDAIKKSCSSIAMFQESWRETHLDRHTVILLLQNKREKNSID